MTKTRFTFLAFLLFISLSSFAQSLSEKDKSEIRERLDQYVTSTKEKKYVSMVEMVYPKIFNFASKEQVTQVFTGLAAQGIDMSFNEMEVTDILPIYDTETVQYALCPYNMDLTVTLASEQLKTPETSEVIFNSIKQTYASSEVSIDKEKFKMQIKGVKYLIAVKDDAYGDEWYFSEFDTGNPMLLKILFPEELITKAEALTKK